MDPQGFGTREEGTSLQPRKAAPKSAVTAKAIRMMRFDLTGRPRRLTIRLRSCEKIKNPKNLYSEIVDLQSAYR